MTDHDIYYTKTSLGRVGFPTNRIWGSGARREEQRGPPNGVAGFSAGVGRVYSTIPKPPFYDLDFPQIGKEGPGPAEETGEASGLGLLASLSGVGGGRG